MDDADSAGHRLTHSRMAGESVPERCTRDGYVSPFRVICPVQDAAGGTVLMLPAQCRFGFPDGGKGCLSAAGILFRHQHLLQPEEQRYLINRFFLSE
ncbi:hypothetical protein [Pantoea sp. WEP]|uniref:hypothetical protein n=1 Tax=Pantoea sp. WEP TaxID=3230025 RepID=UPI001A2F655B|nr:hypothetical protein [Serratia marcescens]HAT4512963.1 hypothetical protein [Serratia marcescens]HAT4536515.1 hypothetical protein [Serratia marcescens]